MGAVENDEYGDHDDTEYKTEREVRDLVLDELTRLIGEINERVAVLAADDEFEELCANAGRLVSDLRKRLGVDG